MAIDRTDTLETELKFGHSAGLRTIQDVHNAWHEVFPKSAIHVGHGYLGGGILYGYGYLAQDKGELSNGYWLNDMLSYSFSIDEDGTYKENGVSVFIQPAQGSWTAYGTSRLRRKTIKNITYEKLLKRFKQVHGLVVANKDNFINLKFDINDKL